jgi:F-type H+-transporting ATPase subunit delta
MRTRAVATRYARALLGLARAQGDPAPIGEALGQATTALEAPSVAVIVRNPAIGPAGREAVVRSLVQSLGLPPLVANCLYLLAERQRLGLVEAVWRAYGALLDRELGRSRAVLRSAVPLTETQVQELLDLLRRLTGKKEIVPILDVDPDLLGGVVAEAEGVVYDGSVRSQLERLARVMATDADT